MKSKPSQARFPIVESLIALVAIAALAIVSYIGAHNQQQSSLQVNTYSTYDYASGGYRAWYELLDAEGVRVERFEQRPAFLDRSVDVYISAANTYGDYAIAAVGGNLEVPTSGDWDALAKWIRAGGHFVWLTDGTIDPEEMNAPEVAKTGPVNDAAVTVARSEQTDGVSQVSGTSRLRVPFDASAGAAPLVADDTGSVVVTYPLGSGTVTIISDESLFENDRLLHADNARFAFDVATSGLTPHGAVAFDEWSHGFVSGDTWWRILPRQFQAALIIIASALVLLVIGTALRFGPVAKLPDESERTSAEYLSSMALLYERGRAARNAIKELADACLREVASSIGLPDSATATSIATRLAGGADGGLGDAVMELDRLRSYEYPHPPDLIRAAQLCSELRKEFTRHGRIGIGRRSTSARRIA